MPISEATVDDLAAVLISGTGLRAVRLIDVRETHEYEDGHVPGAQLISLAMVPDNVSAFSADGPTYVICRSGGRSMRACEAVAQHNPDLQLINIAGGTLAWIDSGREIVSGDQPE